MKKIWVAVPAYGGTIQVDTAHALNTEIYEAMNRKIPLIVTYHQQDPIIHRCRNSMVMRFLESDFTDMIFVDSDVSFPSGTLCRLASHPVDLVCAMYPFRKDPIEFPVRWLDKPELWADPATGLLEIEGAPAGCMRITRHLLETLIDRHPELAYGEEEMKFGKAYALFDFARKDGRFHGEDYVFCDRAREAGFKVWCDPEIEMQHTGMKKFKGHIGNYLKARSNPDPFDAIYRFNEKMAAKAA